jgi:hypothetical protein
LWLRPDGQWPPGITLLRAYARSQMIAAPTILGRALHLDDGMPAMIHGRPPARADLTGRTGRVLRVPLNLEGLGGKASSLACLPVIIKTCGPQQIHGVVVLTLDQQVSVQEAGVHEMGLG